jgi:hypothetical protein
MPVGQRVRVGGDRRQGDAIALWPIAPTKIREGRRSDGARVWLVDDGGGWAGEAGSLLDDEVMHFHGIGLDVGRGLSNVREGPQRARYRDERRGLRGPHVPE